MRRIFIAAAVVAATAYGTAYAETIKSDTIGCASRNDFDRSTSLLLSGDKDAWVRFLTGKVATGQCAMLDAGQSVYLEDFALFSGVACVRPSGETSCFYVTAESVGD